MPDTPPPTDPTALAKFGKLEVVARLLVEGFMAGRHKSPFKGSSVEFVEHRQYHPGDEVRHIDWRAYGKTGRYFIKEYEDETNLRCHLLVDCSGSMAYAGTTLSKFDYARQLATALAYLLLAQRDAVGLMTFDTMLRDRVDPTSRSHNFVRIAELLEARAPGRETSLGALFQTLIPLIKRRSLVVILSDCFDELDPLTLALRMLRQRRHEVLLLHIVAPEEETFPFSKPTQFVNLERADHRVLTDPHRLRAEYRRRYARFCAALRSNAANAGVDYHKIVTDEPYAAALGAYLDARTRSSRSPR